MIKAEKGSIYFLVLAGAIVLVTLVLGLSLHTMQFRQSTRSNTKIDQADIYAELGIRHAIHFTTITPNWRQVLSSGLWLQDIEMNQAIYSVAGIDPVDGNLANNNTDPVNLTCTATIDGVTRILSVQTKTTPLEILSYAVASDKKSQISINTQILRQK